jgi:diguanylate cyclase (GGDEF)-like protein
MPMLVDVQRLRLDAAYALLKNGGVQPPLSEPEHFTIDSLQLLIDGLCELSLRDPLTGLANRRYFESVLFSELDRVSRTGEAALLLMVDIDHFKLINDQHGHPVGDRVLKKVTDTLTACVRPMDTLVRYGGEEFAVILPGCQSTFAHTIAERIRRTIENTWLRVSPSLALNVTVSIGGSLAFPWTRLTGALWTSHADHQLYLAKAKGRNCVCIEEQTDSTVSAEEKDLLYGINSSTQLVESLNPSNSAFSIDSNGALHNDEHE